MAPSVGKHNNLTIFGFLTVWLKALGHQGEICQSPEFLEEDMALCTLYHSLLVRAVSIQYRFKELGEKKTPTASWG